jgi:hypothetical protein
MRSKQPSQKRKKNAHTDAPYLLYWCKSTNTGTKGRRPTLHTPARGRQSK